jgi:hypothetical protein
MNAVVWFWLAPFILAWLASCVVALIILGVAIRSRFER